MPRDDSLSDSYTSDHCCFYNLSRVTSCATNNSPNRIWLHQPQQPQPHVTGGRDCCLDHVRAREGRGRKTLLSSGKTLCLGMNFRFGMHRGTFSGPSGTIFLIQEGMASRIHIVTTKYYSRCGWQSFMSPTTVPRCCRQRFPGMRDARLAPLGNASCAPWKQGPAIDTQNWSRLSSALRDFFSNFTSENNHPIISTFFFVQLKINF